MSTFNQAAQGNQNMNYGQTGNLGGYLMNSGSTFLQNGLNGNGWNFKSAFGDQIGANGQAFNSKLGGVDGSITGYDNAIGAAAGFAGGLLDKGAAHQRTSGKYGYVANTVDSVANTVGMVGNFNPLASGAGKLAMGAVNNITGGTDGMTVQDSLLGSSAVQGALTGIAAATGPIGWGVAGAYLLASGINAATGKTTTDNAYKSFMDKDRLSEVSDAYSDMDLENEAESLYNKKYGGFSRGAYKKAQKKIDEAQMRMTDKIDIRNTAKLGQIRAGMVDANRLKYQMAINGGYKPLAIGKYGLKIDPERLAEAKRIAKCIKQNKRKVAFTNIIPVEAREAMRDVTKVPNDALPFFKDGGNIELFQNGGDVNVIPEGALHARKHHMENDEHITKKGIPVVDINGKQQAEIECNEIIFRKEVTKRLEELAKNGSDEAAIEAGKLLAQEIIENTDDRTGLIQQVTGDSLEKIPKAAGGFDFSKIGQYASLASNVVGLFQTKKQTESSKDDLASVEQQIEELKNRKGERFVAENMKAMSENPAQVDENGNIATSYDPKKFLEHMNGEVWYQKQRALQDLETRRKQLAKGIETSNQAAQGYQTGLLNDISGIVSNIASKKSNDIPNESGVYTTGTVASPVPEGKLTRPDSSSNSLSPVPEGKLDRGEKGTKLPEFKTYEELVEYLNKTGRGSDKDYDLKAAYNDPEVYQFWRKEEEENPGKGHWLDKYKKESHITYSNESILGDNPKQNGGYWINADGKDIFIVSPYLENKHSFQDYLDYFINNEPNASFRYKGVTYSTGRKKK